MNQDEFIQQHGNDGMLSPQLAAQLLEFGQGDTAHAENDSAPNAITSEEQHGTEQTSVDTDPANSVVMAKDGVHTIDYQKLVDARDGEKHWKAQANAAQQELETLRQQAQQRADAGTAPTVADQQLAVASAAIDAGVDPDLFGDFSEEAIAKGVRSIVSQSQGDIEQRVAAMVKAQVSEALAPQQRKQEAEVLNGHFQAIYDKHPDLDSIVESKELGDWIARQPTFAQPGYHAVLTQGTAAEVVEFLDSFKAATGKTAAPDARRAAQAVIANTRQQPPASLSDFPGSTAAAGSRMEAMAAMDARQLGDAMADMTPAQIEHFLNTQL